jgi:hypothetical protein
MKFYLSGPMSGIENYNRPAFFELETVIKSVSKKIDPEHNHLVFNPARIPDADNKKYRQLMRECLWGLTYCSHFVQLPGWEHSSGALIEYTVAVILEMPIIKSTDIQTWLVKNLNPIFGPKR